MHQMPHYSGHNIEIIDIKGNFNEKVPVIAVESVVETFDQTFGQDLSELLLYFDLDFVTLLNRQT